MVIVYAIIGIITNITHMLSEPVYYSGPAGILSHTEMTRLWQGCRVLATLSQAGDNLVTTL